MGRKTYCTLSTANLLHNLNVVKSHAPNSKVMAMIKANAYGHGLRSVAQRLEGHVDALGVASIDEAMALRQTGIKTAITLIEGVFAPEELFLAATQDFSAVFHNERQIDWLKHMEPKKKITAWLKLDTGMGRLGFSPENAAHALHILSCHPSIEQSIGLISHLHVLTHPNII